MVPKKGFKRKKLSNQIVFRNGAQKCFPKNGIQKCFPKVIVRRLKHIVCASAFHRQSKRLTLCQRQTNTNQIQSQPTREDAAGDRKRRLKKGTHPRWRSSTPSQTRLKQPPHPRSWSQAAGHRRRRLRQPIHPRWRRRAARHHGRRPTPTRSIWPRSLG